VANTDLVVAIDDAATMDIIRLFNEPAGRGYLAGRGVPEAFLDQLPLFGISTVANVLSAIKMAKWYELGSADILVTVATDSMELYESRVRELRDELGEFTELNAAAAYHRWLLGTTTDNMMEMDHPTRKRVHNLKYFTWVEQQGKTYDEIQAQWHDPDYWTSIQALVPEIDTRIEAFNEMVAAG
jgi:hypothetical protein